MRQDARVLEVWMVLIFSWENINKQTARTLNRTGITANVMTQTVSLCSCQQIPTRYCVSPMTVYCFGWRDTTDSTTSPSGSSASYLVFEIRLRAGWRDTTRKFSYLILIESWELSHPLTRVRKISIFKESIWIYHTTVDRSFNQQNHTKVDRSQV